MTDYDVCVVGAGLFGSSTAKHLAEKYPTMKTVLIGPEEPEDLKATDILGAHYDEGRILFSAGDDSIWATIAKESVRCLHEIERKSGIQFFNEVGMLSAGLKEGYVTNITNISASVLGYKPEVLDSSALKAKFPYLRFKEVLEGRFFARSAGYLSPRKLVLAQQKIAKDCKCDIFHDVVKYVTPASQSKYRIETEGGLCLSCKKVVIATGAFTNHRDLLPHGLRPKMEYLCETVMLVQVQGDTIMHMRNMPPFFTMDMLEGKETEYMAVYVLPPIKYPDGNFYLKFGHGNQVNRKLNSPEEIQDWYVHGKDQHVERHLLSMARTYFPGND